MANREAAALLLRDPRLFWGKVIEAFIKSGWQPPRPDSRIVEAVGRDIYRITGIRGWGKPTLSLTDLELRELQRMADGFSVEESAARRGVSIDSVKSMRKNINRKLAARNGPHAVAIGIREAMIE